MDEEDWLFEMCSGRAAWTIAPKTDLGIDLAEVGARIAAAGWTITLENRLCWTFTGSCDLTLYPSGKLLIKTDTAETAREIGRRHLREWLTADA